MLGPWASDRPGEEAEHHRDRGHFVIERRGSGLPVLRDSSSA